MERCHRPEATPPLFLRSAIQQRARTVCGLLAGNKRYMLCSLFCCLHFHVHDRETAPSNTTTERPLWFLGSMVGVAWLFLFGLIVIRERCLRSCFKEADSLPLCMDCCGEIQFTSTVLFCACCNTNTMRNQWREWACMLCTTRTSVNN